MASKPTVYLAGPVAAYADGGAGWRDRVQREYDDRFAFRDPLSKYNVPVDDLTVTMGESDGPDEVSVTELVESDKEMLADSDAVLVGYSDVQSIGTPMEVMWAYERDVPVVIWVRDETPVHDLSPWYQYHATAITNSLKQAALRVYAEAQMGRIWSERPAEVRDDAEH
jgi:nucleoside 2-deoxyribosyltransferase